MEEYAKTFKFERQSGTFAREGEIPMLFPMYTMPLEEVLKLEEMKPHGKLMKENILVHFVDEMGRAIFVSHQWLCPWKPDPKLAQFRHLQLALKNLLSTSKRWIDREVTTEFASPAGPSIPIEEFQKKPLSFGTTTFRFLKSMISAGVPVTLTSRLTRHWIALQHTLPIALSSLCCVQLSKIQIAQNSLGLQPGLVVAGAVWRKLCESFCRKEKLLLLFMMQTISRPF